ATSCASRVGGLRRCPAMVARPADRRGERVHTGCVLAGACRDRAFAEKLAAEAAPTRAPVHLWEWLQPRAFCGRPRSWPCCSDVLAVFRQSVDATFENRFQRGVIAFDRCNTGRNPVVAFDFSPVDRVAMQHKEVFEEQTQCAPIPFPERVDDVQLAEAFGYVADGGVPRRLPEIHSAECAHDLVGFWGNAVRGTEACSPLREVD